MAEPLREFTRFTPGGSRPLDQANRLEPGAPGPPTVWVKKSHLRFSDIFPKRLGIFSPNFTRLLYVPRLHIFIQLSATLTKLCHIKRDHPVHIICSKCPPSAETHAFRRLLKSLIALWNAKLEVLHGSAPRYLVPLVQVADPVPDLIHLQYPVCLLNYSQKAK